MFQRAAQDAGGAAQSEQELPAAVDQSGGVGRTHHPGHGGAVPRLRHARPPQDVLRD